MKKQISLAFLLGALSNSAFAVDAKAIHIDGNKGDTAVATGGSSINIDKRPIPSSTSTKDSYDWDQHPKIPQKVRDHIQQEMVKNEDSAKRSTSYFVEKYLELERCIKGDCEESLKKEGKKFEKELELLQDANFKELEEIFSKEKDENTLLLYTRASLLDIQMKSDSAASTAYQKVLESSSYYAGAYYVLGVIKYYYKVDIKNVRDIFNKRLRTSDGGLNTGLLFDKSQYRKFYYGMFSDLADIYKGSLISASASLSAEEEEAFNNAVDLYSLLLKFNDKDSIAGIGVEIRNIEIFKSLEYIYRKKGGYYYTNLADEIAKNRNNLEEGKLKSLEKRIVPDVKKMFDEAKANENGENYEKAEKVYNKILASHRDIGIINTQEFADALNGLGAIYARRRSYGEAEILFERAIAINNKRLGNNSTLFLDYRRLAALFDEQQKYEKAEKYYRISIDIEYKNRNRGEKSVDNFTSTKESLKKVYFIQGKKDKMYSLDKEYPDR